MASRVWEDSKQSTPAAFPLTAADFWSEMESRAFIIPTGCDHLDELLEGGLYSGEVTELCGAPGVGKTQLCYSVTIETSKASTNTVAYLSTNCSFNASRLSSMLACHNDLQQENEDVLERIHCYTAGDIFEALQVLSDIQYKMASQHDTFHNQLRLIVIDNVTILISPLLGGAQFEGHAIMNHLSIILTKLAQDYCLIVLVVNNTVRDTNMLDDIKPALGNSWAHVPSTRLMLYYGNGRERIGSIVKSSRQRSGVNTSYYITDTGLAMS